VRLAVQTFQVEDFKVDVCRLPHELGAKTEPSVHFVHDVEMHECVSAEYDSVERTEADWMVVDFPEKSEALAFRQGAGVVPLMEALCVNLDLDSSS
jgi:hypothetical protein